MTILADIVTSLYENHEQSDERSFLQQEHGLDVLSHSVGSCRLFFNPKGLITR